MRLQIRVSNGKVAFNAREGFKVRRCDGFDHVGLKNQVIIDEKNIVEYVKKNNGIAIIENQSEVNIYNDPFRTIPLYITKLDNEVIVFSNFEDYFTLQKVDRSVDIAGFWETVFYGAGIWTRTVYKNVKQMVAASKIVIKKESGEYVIDKYWDFKVFEDKSITSAENAAFLLYEHLDCIFSSVKKFNTKFILGLSGGVDSRITMAFLSRHIEKSSLKSFTYGYDDRILEYKYAKEVATALGFKRPDFYRLDQFSYERALNTLVRETCGQIGMQHCHTYDYLRQHARFFADCTHISSLYSDAILGWDAVYPKRKDKIEDSSFFAMPEIHIDNNTKQQIEEDIYQVLKDYDYCSGFSSIEEFKYVTERNVKFHTNMAYSYNKYIYTIVPFANYDLLSYMLSVPIKYRYQKRLVDVMLNKYFPEVSLLKIGNISSRFQWGPHFAGYIPYWWCEVLNKINFVFLLSTKGRFQVFNKYITEIWRPLLYRYFEEKLLKSLSMLHDLGIITDKQKKVFSILPKRSKGVGEIYQIIGLTSLIS